MDSEVLSRPGTYELLWVVYIDGRPVSSNIVVIDVPKVEPTEHKAYEAVVAAAGILQHANRTTALRKVMEAFPNSAYARIAGLDIGDNPGVLATLYHLGAPTVRARRLRTGRGGFSGTVDMPQVNFYGAWVNLHAEEVARILGVPPPPTR